MWLVPITQLLVLAAGVETAAGRPAAAPATPRPIATRQAEFGIPFSIERTDDPARQPAQVQLYASNDRGKTWHLASRVEPSRRHFVFAAPNDGEYWFRICTLDRSGQLRPATSGPPGLIVVVDTVAPTLQLEAQRGAAGQISARWKIYEPHPQLSTLVMQYRTTAGDPWQKVAIDRAKLQGTGAAQTGEVTWWPQGGSGQVQIRAEMADLAGNPAVSHAIVNVAHPTQPAARTAPGPWRASQSGDVAAGDVAAGPNSPPPTAWPDTTPRTPEHLLTKGQPPNSRLANYPQQFGQSNTRAAALPYPSTGLPAFDASQAAAAAPNAVRSAPPTGPAEDFRGFGLPAGVRPRMVDSKLFELSYDDESLGAAGSPRVELWGTRNGGRTWRSFALDNDNRSPLLTSVAEEGIYGFRVVVGNGPGVRLPQSGDLPDIWIGVDLTKPTVRISGVEQGIGADSGRLLISWQADDWMPAARPVTLKFSESPAGPWTTLAAGLQNTGRYAWPIDSRAPQMVYLRLEMVDASGNVGTFETSKPVALDRFRPAARIRDVRPLGQTSQRPGGPYRW